MRIIGCDLHARQQTLAMLDTETGEMVNLTLMHEGNAVREFYSELPRPVPVGIEATGSMHWFLNLMEELGIECRVGHPATIRAAEPRKQKHDRRDADLILKLLAENRNATIFYKTYGNQVLERQQTGKGAPFWRSLSNALKTYSKEAPFIMRRSSTSSHEGATPKSVPFWDPARSLLVS